MIVMLFTRGLNLLVYTLVSCFCNR